jgi:hypothetical protein
VEQGPPAIRGTQTFVGVMAFVWRNRILTALEVLWRWGIGAPLLALVTWQIRKALHGAVIDTSALEAMTVFQPVAAFSTTHSAAAVLAPLLKPVLVWLFPLCAVLWIVVAAIGRQVVLRRMEPQLRFSSASVLKLGALRALLLGAVWGLWIWGVWIAGRIAITGPASHGSEPSVVLYCAMLICGSIALYVFWAAVSWPFQLAPQLAMAHQQGAISSLAEAFRSHNVREKLLEVNMVMNIVKIAVLVLAMVLSASPLPFVTVETETFLTYWWIGVILIYMAALDYFHVVRASAYLRLWQVYDLSAKG